MSRMYEEIQIPIEIISASICFVLVWFMAKPYILTRETRYLGLPLGFSFLGISSIAIAISLSIPNYYFTNQLVWLHLLPKTFALLFFAVTYYFSKKPTKKSPLIWNLSISLMILILVTLIISGIIIPQLASQDYFTSAIYFRICDIISLFYISIHTLKSHLKNTESATIVIPFGFILFGISQYSLLIWSVDRSLFAFWGTQVLRLTALFVFLFVSYKAFYSSDEQGRVK